MKAKPGRQAEADKKHETIKNSCKLGMVYPSPSKTKTRKKARKNRPPPIPDSILKVRKSKISGSVVDEDLHVDISQTIDTCNA